MCPYHTLPCLLDEGPVAGVPEWQQRGLWGFVSFDPSLGPTATATMVRRRLTLLGSGFVYMYVLSQIHVCGNRSCSCRAPGSTLPLLPDMHGLLAFIRQPRFGPSQFLSAVGAAVPALPGLCTCSCCALCILCVLLYLLQGVAHHACKSGAFARAREKDGSMMAASFWEPTTKPLF